jgi:hypothetical protein
MEEMNSRVRECAFLLLSLLAPAAALGQVIRFESNGLKYQTLTRSGVTIMLAHLPNQVREFSVFQVAVSNGGAAAYNIRPEDFTYLHPDGASSRAWPARAVVAELIEKGGRGDVIGLVRAFEAAVYGNTRLRATNGFEARRQAALAEFGSAKLKAAATASAIVLVHTKLAAGESTDGAVFFQTDRKPLDGRVVVRTNTDSFEFEPE